MPTSHSSAGLRGTTLPTIPTAEESRRSSGMSAGIDRILTTHVGSLPRSQAVTEVLFAREREESRDRARDDAVITAAVAEVVRRQVEIGLDFVSDGEMSKISYATYIARRLSGFDGDTPREPGQDLVEFPGLLRKLAERGATAKYRRPRCVGPVSVRDSRPLEVDIANLSAAAAAAHPTGAFMNAASPGVVALFQPNDFYRTQDEYLDRKSTRLNSSHGYISYAVFCLKKKNTNCATIRPLSLTTSTTNIQPCALSSCKTEPTESLTTSRSIHPIRPTMGTITHALAFQL